MKPIHTSLQELAGRVGVWTGSHEKMLATRSGEVAAELESLGYPAMWIPESNGREAFTNAHLLLAKTSRVIIATGIANIYGRDAFSSVSIAKTLNAVFENRFVLGIGVSHRPTVQDLRGHSYETPYESMVSYLSAMDAVEMKAPESGQSFARVVAALGPKMVALAARAADGIHTYKVTPEHTAAVRDVMGDGFIAVEQAIVLTRDRGKYFDIARAHLRNTLHLNNYLANWRRLGFTEEDFADGGSARLCEALVAHGGEDEILTRIDEHFAAGADHVCVQVLNEDPNIPPMSQWRELAPALTQRRNHGH